MEWWREANPSDLLTKLKTIARAFENAAPVIAKQMEERERQAKLERRRWEEGERRERREEAARRRAEAFKASRTELAAIVERWAEAKRVEAFFQDAGRRATALSEVESAAMLARLERAKNSSAAWMRSSGSGHGRRRRSASLVATYRATSWGELATLQA